MSLINESTSLELRLLRHRGGAAAFAAAIATLIGCSGGSSDDAKKAKGDAPETAAATGSDPGKAAHVVTTREASRPAGARRSCLNQVSSVHGVSAERQGGLEPQVALAFARNMRVGGRRLGMPLQEALAAVNRVER